MSLCCVLKNEEKGPSCAHYDRGDCCLNSIVAEVVRRGESPELFCLMYKPKDWQQMTDNEKIARWLGPFIKNPVGQLRLVEHSLSGRAVSTLPHLGE